jgi:hypothetical protein
MYLNAGNPDLPSVIASDSFEMSCSAILRDAVFSASTIASI